MPGSKERQRKRARERYEHQQELRRQRQRKIRRWSGIALAAVVVIEHRDRAVLDPHRHGPAKQRLDLLRPGRGGDVEVALQGAWCVVRGASAMKRISLIVAIGLALLSQPIGAQESEVGRLSERVAPVALLGDSNVLDEEVDELRHVLRPE